MKRDPPRESPNRGPEGWQPASGNPGCGGSQTEAVVDRPPIRTQVAIRTLKQIHAATHPAAMLDKTQAPPLPAAHAASDPVAVRLFATLDAEAEEEKE